MQKAIFTQLKPYRFRILAGALFCAFLISTWFVFHQKPKYPEELHISLQDQLKNIIQETLVKQKPQAKNLKFQKMWTQSTKKQDQISAHFKYSFDDEEDVNVSIEGQALMNRKSLGSSENHDLWSVDHIQINNQKMEFLEPIILLSSKFIGKIKEDIEEEEDGEEGGEDDDKEAQEAQEAQESEIKPSSADNLNLTEEPTQAPTTEEDPSAEKEMEKEDTNSNQELSPKADEN